MGEQHLIYTVFSTVISFNGKKTGVANIRGQLFTSFAGKLVNVSLFWQRPEGGGGGEKIISQLNNFKTDDI
jgi:hypothetical protein